MSPQTTKNVGCCHQTFSALKIRRRCTRAHFFAIWRGILQMTKRKKLALDAIRGVRNAGAPSTPSIRASGQSRESLSFMSVRGSSGELGPPPRNAQIGGVKRADGAICNAQLFGGHGAGDVRRGASRGHLSVAASTAGGGLPDRRDGGRAKRAGGVCQYGAGPARLGARRYPAGFLDRPGVQVSPVDAGLLPPPDW